MRQLALYFTMFLFFVSSAVGQTTFGSIPGSVTDPSGAVVPGVTVSVTNEGTGLERKVVTSSGGVFNVPNLDVGTYGVTVTATGFATYERSGLVLSSNQVLNIDASLKLETTSTVTEVQAATPAIHTATTSLSDVTPQQG